MFNWLRRRRLSDGARKRLLLVAARAEEAIVETHVANIIDLLVNLDRWQQLGAAGQRLLQQACDRNAAQMLERWQDDQRASVARLAQQRLDAANRSHTTHVHVGQAPEVIARLAGDLACDLIVMGTHGRTGIAELVMGSVASRVLHLAPCPVLLVK